MMRRPIRWLVLCLLAAVWLAARPAESADEALNLSARDNALLAPVRSAVAAKDYDAALAQAGKAGPDVSREALPELFMLAGQCYQARGDMVRAGLCYMRLVIHFPNDRQTPEAVLRSAGIAERLKRPQSARQLYETLIQRYPGSAQAAVAREALQRAKPSP